MMDHNNENTLKLFQDIKEMLLGGILLLTGGLLIIAGFVANLTMLGDGFFILSLIGGLLLLFLGGLHLWHGWTAHEVVERQEEAQNMKP